MIYYNPHKWLNRLFDFHGSVVKEVTPRLICVMGWSAFIVFLHHHGYINGISSTLHALVGVALGLLLVFRTNASYDRYWEGRKFWGGITNECRNLVRAASVHLAGHRRLMQNITQWTACFPWAAANSLRGESYLGPMVHEMAADDVQAILQSQHGPSYVAQRITGYLAEARSRGALTDITFVYLDSNVQQLIDYIGGCERIRKTPLPFAYVVHLRRTLIMYTFSLPFALVNDMGWYSLLGMFMVSFLLYGIEEIGVEIEGPFGDDENDLPMQEFCTTIHNNLYALTGLAHPPVEPLPDE